MKESGIGRENGVEAFEACKSVPEPVEGIWFTGVAHATQIRRVNQLS